MRRLVGVVVAGVLLVLAGAYVLAFGPATDQLPAISAVLVGAGLGGSMLLVWAGLKPARSA